MPIDANHKTRRFAGPIAWLACACLSGCAAWTNPVANGIPVRLLPPDLLAEPKEDWQTISLTLLRQKPPDVYRLGPGDLLGVFIEGVLGGAEQLPPVNFPQGSDLPPSLGYPIPVREDGTVPLPLIEPVSVKGLTITEAEQSINKVYRQRGIIREGSRTLVTLIQPRQTRVLVIRQDSPGGGINVQAPGIRGLRSPTVTTNTKRGTGWIVDLPAYENDVLTALAQTGGLPGTDAANEVVIQRGYADASRADALVAEQFKMAAPANRPPAPTGKEGDVIRIPLRLPPGAPVPFKPQDILLQRGDIVFIEARDTQFFYTGGLLPSLEVPIPRDYDLGVLEAIARVGGPIFNGAVNSNNLSGSIVAPGIGNPSPSLLTVLRRTPGGGQVTIRVDLNRAAQDPRENILVQAGDVLVLQETPGQAFARYVTQVFQFNLLSHVISRTDTTGVTEVTVP